VLARILLCFMIVAVPVFAQGAGLNELYSTDYDGFWQQWRELRKAAIECSDQQKMAVFLSSAVETLGNAEVTEANAEEIEAIALSDAECVLNGLLLLSVEERRRAVGAFLVNPIYVSSNEIESALSRVWARGVYTELREVYESESRDR
jgi:hypothetical protein